MKQKQDSVSALKLTKWSDVKRQNIVFDDAKDHKKFDEFKNEVITIHDFIEREGKDGEFLVIKLEHNNEIYTTSRGGLICKMLKEAREDNPNCLPVKVRVVTKRGQYGSYLDFEDA